MDNLLIKEYARIKLQELNNSPYSCLDSEKIDINPHQVEAFIFAVSAIKTGGAILADEVGLGKTIEAGLVLKYLLKKDYRRILLIMPSNLRKQWQIELEEKFDIEALIVDSQNLDVYYDFIDNEKSVVITSYNFAAKRKDIFASVPWDFIVFDEAHRLRNIHKNNSKTAKRIYELTKSIPKLMLTATPMQNTLLDMFGLVQFIDDKIFLDKRIFYQKYIKNQEFSELKTQIEPILQRTLRSEVADYLQFKSRIGITVDFNLTPMEGVLYKLVNDYLRKEIIYAIPSSNRNLITVVIRKLLASSSRAVAATFEVMRNRLITLKESSQIESVDKGLDYFLDFLDEDTEEEEESENIEELYDRNKVNEFIQHEIDQVDQIITVANNIKTNAKLDALKKALQIAFERQEELNISKKAVVFTESVRTQEYLYEELTNNGYADSILVFNGSMSDSKTKEIYRAWRSRNYGSLLGSRSVEIKNAIVEAFRDEYEILLVTDSGSEGLNLQFCNTVINYDLPWNPQRIEQRIGRCHRYGQKNDVIVINLLNTENIADRRVYEILSEKFELFEGVFGASDKAIGLLENGENFEKRILQIYQQCKSTAEFNKEFKDLEKELNRKRNVKFQELKSLITKRDTDAHRKAFEAFMRGVDKYFKDKQYWFAIKEDKSKKIYPIVYKIEHMKTEGLIEHGYIFIGGFYNNQELLSPVLCIYDSNQKKVDVSEQEILDIFEQIQDTELYEIALQGQEVELCGDLIHDEKMHEYQKKYEEVMLRNSMKIDNWVMLRCEEYNLSIQECKIEIDKLQERYKDEKNFMAKIEVKKKIETVEQKRSEMMLHFHEYTTEIGVEADKMKTDFKSQFDIAPILVSKIIVKF